ncbi:DUF6497 family protein [Aliiroseovarius sp.]|uniref:DUF6497 family protein n=1 Tax=Aliiroseovarius sp. TaxID=1872442 RepID=UPI00260382FA|nr:DUF6497 family protein [Aliiroseovarius sp.]
MRRKRATWAGLVLLTGLLPLVGQAAEEVATLVVPSGQEVRFLDAIWTGEGAARVVRFRFVAPAIARDRAEVEFSQAEADMAHLCEDFALPRLAGEEPPPAQIIISLADRPLDFGLADPEATQFFEAFRPDHGSCIWEGF